MNSRGAASTLLKLSVTGVRSALGGSAAGRGAAQLAAMTPAAAAGAQQWRSTVFVVNVQKNNVDQAYGALSKSMREAGGV
jgi:hypothetical protein